MRGGVKRTASPIPVPLCRANIRSNDGKRVDVAQALYLCAPSVGRPSLSSGYFERISFLGNMPLPSVIFVTIYHRTFGTLCLPHRQHLLPKYARWNKSVANATEGWGHNLLYPTVADVPLL